VTFRIPRFEGKSVYAAFVFVTANYIVNSLDQPEETQAVNTIEGPNTTATEEAGVSGTET